MAVFFNLDAVQISAITFSIERIVALYKSGLEIRKAKIELERLDEPEMAAKLDERIQVRIKEGISALADELRDRYKNIDDDTMLNDYTVKLKFELSHLARRIDQGARAEIRVALPSKPVEPKTPDPTQQDQLVDYEKQMIAYKNAMTAYGESLQAASEVASMSERLVDQFTTLQQGEPLLLAQDDANPIPPQ